MPCLGDVGGSKVSSGWIWVCVGSESSCCFWWSWLKVLVQQMVLLIEGIFGVMLNSVMADLSRFDLIHSLLLSELALCNCFCALLALTTFHLSVAF